MDNSAVVSSDQITHNKKLLSKFVGLFLRKSTQFQNIIDHPQLKDPKVYMHLKIAYELGEYFNSIMAILLSIDTRFTTRKVSSILQREKPAPAPLKWNNENSYELRLFEALFTDGAYSRHPMKQLEGIHYYINYGVNKIIASTPDKPWNPLTTNPMVVLAGGGITRRRKGKCGSRRN